jgi:2'-5' RNA ligase
MSEAATHTALCLPVPEAERVVAQLRERYDPSAGAGIPAHITLVTPFAPITDELHDELRAFFAAVAPFPFELTQTGRFPDTLYLAPEPAAPFEALIAQLSARYPDHPPYGGAFDTVIPHVTVAHATRGATLDAIGAVVRSTLPVQALATTALLFEGSNDAGWTERGRFRLGTG